ncbi:1-hydroxy-2-methyl-2-(E)-butenyl 4-diphosphate synthase [Armatimonas rosea]|uniref:4-hydroxy-3-methylbut-2-en-1-yl diphosphate synthase (flavodoxin) n=1 Tax=Armatimonas rosea TaxID=685828 RepID=A0A7W9W7U9_ARMRO|nr:(E)-4-hydroxy-3-methylbut-2-enyl-diphosphate synthase [Armatimonas rosea]MBB6051601.1 1-hydroxy-2-methyl-2-(E)-butenyl 4-diphosphate synthase [Armatimonas rosea]
MSLYDSLPLTFPRRKTRPVRVGKVTIGGDHPVVVQSMITAETHQVEDCVRQITEMARKGAEIVRVTTPSMRDAHCLGQIKEKLRARLVDVPLVADVHHQGSDIAVAVAEYVDKVRLNPGLFVFHKHTGRSEFTDAEHDEQREAIEASLVPVIEACKKRDIAMRIGVNHGSLAERMLVTYGDTPEGMVQSALEYLRICEKHDFRNLVISLKASRVPIMLAANRLMVQRMDAEGMDYPLHLGVTEAGDGQYARIKSTTGIGTLLAEGIGDTIRVSLSEDPIQELPVCYEILQALGLRKTQVEFIACPSCGRTKFDLPTVLNQVKRATSHLVGLDIAVMGCFPPGETVVTEAGFVPIETVEQGQKVLTQEGTYSPVTAVDTHSFEGELVELKLRGAPSILVTPNHPILALERTGKAKKDRTRWQNMAEVPGLGQEPSWQGAENLHKGHVLLYPVLQGEQALTSIPEASQLSMNEDFLRLAGYFAAEGSLGGRNGIPRQVFLTFGSDEPELAQDARDIFCRLGASVSLRERPERNTIETVVHSTEWATLFAQLFGRRAENKHFPQWMLTLPKTQQVTLLRTLWLCDGYTGVVRGYPRATYVTVSRQLAYQVHQLLLRLGIPVTLVRRQPKNRQEVYFLSVTNADALRTFASTLGYEIAIPEERQNRARLALDEHFLYLPVLSTGRIAYKGNVHNLEVAGSGTYVSSLAVVHNCIVNGPGEMADADYGYVGKAGGKITLYRKREEIKTVDQSVGVEELIALIKADGMWQEPKKEN